MRMLEHVYEKVTGLKWEHEDEEIQKIWIMAWNASLKAINQQCQFIYYPTEDK